MSKTIADQSKGFLGAVKAMKEKFGQLQDKGITQEQLDTLETGLSEVYNQNELLDQEKEQLRKKMQNFNSHLAEVKQNLKAVKKVVKQNFLQEKWIEFGIQDKR